MSNNENQQNPKAQEAPKDSKPKEGENKTESSGSKSEYKGNNPGGSTWKDKKKA